MNGDEDTPLAITLRGTDTENDALTFTVAAPPAHGTLSLNADGSFSYTPAANFNGSDSFSYKANDGTTNSAAATVSRSAGSAPNSSLAPLGLMETMPMFRRRSVASMVSRTSRFAPKTTIGCAS